MSTRVAPTGDRKKGFLAPLPGAHLAKLRHTNATFADRKGNLTAIGGSQLFVAVYRGNRAIVELLLKQTDIVVNKSDASGRTPLTLATELRLIGIARELEERGAVLVDPSRRTMSSEIGHFLNERKRLQRRQARRARRGILSFREAVHEGDSDFVELLLDEGIDPTIVVDECIGESVYKHAWRPLHVACELGHIRVVVLLLETGVCDVNEATPDGLTPLLLASKNGHVGTVRYLLIQPRIRIDKCSIENGRTPLMMAAIEGHCAIVEMLLSRSGIDINLRDKNGSTALFFAAERGDVNIVEHLLFQGKTDKNLKAKVRVNESAWQKEVWMTPRQIALQKGHADIVKLLDMERETWI